MLGQNENISFYKRNKRVSMNTRASFSQVTDDSYVNGYEAFAQVTRNIRVKKGESITFINIAPALNDPLDVLTNRLGLETGDVILGVPTRGIPWANYLAKGTGAQVISLYKEEGNKVPGLEFFAEAATVYSGGKKTRFLVDPIDLEVLRKAHSIWIADDVCESGSTLKALYDRCESLCKNVRAVPFVSFSDSPQEHWILPFCVYDRERQFFVPGDRLLGKHHSILFTLRGSFSSGGSKVYGLPTMSDLMVAYCASHEGATIGDISWKKFPGGAPNIVFAPPPKNQNVVFIYDGTSSDKNQDGVVHALARNCTGKMTVIVPYLSSGTMERVDVEGTLATAQTHLYSLCTGMPRTAKGPVKLKICTIHQTGTRFYTGENVFYQPWNILPRLVQQYRTHCPEFVVAFPDDGAYKRFGSLSEGRSCVVFSKIREGSKRLLTLQLQKGPKTLKGSHVVIVDDLVRSGSTMMEAAKKCKEEGAASVTAIFVHADFDPGKAVPFAQCPYFDRIYCSDSVPRKVRKLQLAAPSRVLVHSIFKNHQVHLNMPLVASLSEEKLWAARMVMEGEGIWAGAVPSHVPEQPFDEEGPRGCENRLYGCTFLCLGRSIAMESYIVDSEEQVTDVTASEEHVQAMWTDMNGKIITGHCEQPFSIPADILELVVSRSSKSVGALLQERYNLSNASEWLEHFGEFKLSRKIMLLQALETYDQEQGMDLASSAVFKVK